MSRLEVHLDGEWVPVDGVTSVELDEEQPAPEALERVEANLRRTLFKYLSIGVRRAETPPRALPQRPAWQSPYGPPRRR
ncbi:hypothetical protein ACFYOI_03660 [Streptomyces microflavus]|uniref:hypothetical protein n=1 Tax=Streptomyces microflavus TaxID=1919 RepID=UPI0033B1C600